MPHIARIDSCSILFIFISIFTLELTSWCNCSFENPSFLHIKKMKLFFFIPYPTPFLLFSPPLSFSILFYSLRFWFLHIFFYTKGLGHSQPRIFSGSIISHLTDKNVVSLASGCYHSIAITNNGMLYMFGRK